MSTQHTRLRSRALAAAAVLTLGTAAALAGATAASAAADVIEVTDISGSGAGSLSNAISDANVDPDPSTITFSAAVVASGNITVADGGLPFITAPLTIQGPAAGTLAINANDGGDWGFRATPGAPVPAFAVAISDLTIVGFTSNLFFTNVEAQVDRVVLDGGGGNGASLLIANTAFTGTDITVKNFANDGVNASDTYTELTPISFDGLAISDGAGDGAGFGLGLRYLGSTDAVASFTHVNIARTGYEGIRLTLSDGAHVDVTNADVSANGRGIRVASTDASASIVGSVFHHNDFASGVSLDIADDSHVELIDSFVSGNQAGAGAGIAALVADSQVEISGTVINGNTAGSSGGGIYLGQLRGADASFSVIRSTITGNTAANGGGGITLWDIGEFTPSAGVYVADSEIIGNKARDGAGVAVFQPGLNAADSALPSVYFERTTIADNEADDNGGGAFLSVYGFGNYGPVAFVNSTFAGNTAGARGGAAYIDSDVGFDAYFDLTTIADNSSGIFLPTSSATAEIRYSILADNGTSDLERDDATIEVDWSLVEAPGGSAATSDVAAGTGNIVGADPELETLALNGGETRTMRPANTSPAVNAGDPSLTTGDLPGDDQRGGSRLVSGLDLGAVELTTLELAGELAATGSSPVAPTIASLLLLAGGTALFARRKPIRD